MKEGRLQTSCLEAGLERMEEGKCEIFAIALLARLRTVCAHAAGAEAPSKRRGIPPSVEANVTFFTEGKGRTELREWAIAFRAITTDFQYPAKFIEPSIVRPLG